MGKELFSYSTFEQAFHYWEFHQEDSLAIRMDMPVHRLDFQFFIVKKTKLDIKI